ncbi:PA2169 family four-helix-bundle protein [Mucilaginibacter limnophilus]|uniref:PA2169 family four-helix-bundle protein n=1 Tax=Mucilaginibacter limnophilus TaxID=1932778 RepID=A0A3S2V2S6_9SPHI|nr:PA2169 family four-helix-bundle protein [Mucilaginibacter limnophilus]RVU01783.1 PA2169 family four-helix-bundle protein [Mucilaginibacter limnophilus]
METIEKSVEVLNDLIQLNNDRVDGFTRASKELSPEDNDLQNLFTMFAQDSRTNVQELTAAVAQLGDQPDHGNSITGTIHRAWLDVKATFSGHDRKSILEECERGEDAIKKAYQSALAEELPATVAVLLSTQQQKINEGHDRIKLLRDSAV